MSKDLVAGSETWKNLKAVDKALREAKVPTKERYFVDDKGYVHGPVTITRAELERRKRSDI